MIAFMMRSAGYDARIGQGADHELPTVHDLIREPSVEALLEYAKKYDEARGKFVRIGGIILLAPMTDCTMSGHEPQHWQIMDAGYQSEDDELRQRLIGEYYGTDSDKCLRDQKGLLDAGGFAFSSRGTDVVNEITGVYIGGSSQSFGRADEGGRRETARLMRGNIGHGIEVTTY